MADRSQIHILCVAHRREPSVVLLMVNTTAVWKKIDKLIMRVHGGSGVRGRGSPLTHFIQATFLRRQLIYPQNFH